MVPFLFVVVLTRKLNVVEIPFGATAMEDDTLCPPSAHLRIAMNDEDNAKIDEQRNEMDQGVSFLTWAVLITQIVMLVILFALVLKWQCVPQEEHAPSPNDIIRDYFAIQFVDTLPLNLTGLWFGLPSLTSTPAGWSLDNPIVISVPVQQGASMAFVSWDKSDTTMCASYVASQKAIVFRISSWGAPSSIGVAFVKEIKK